MRGKLNDESALTQSRIRELLDYEPDTGIFRWKVRAGRSCPGDIAGWRSGSGYVRISLDNQEYQAHRLAFLWMTGSFPEGDVDHINRDRLDNRWSNLRQASRTQNIGNSSMRKNNTSGVRGVSWNKECKRWRVQICVNGRQKYMGLWDTIEQASDVYNAAAKEYFGEYFSP